MYWISKNVMTVDAGLVEDAEWGAYLKKYPVDLALAVRGRLLRKVEGLTEKFNRKSRYFGYRRAGGSDVVYLYVQKKGLRIDVRVSRGYEDTLRRAGFEVHYSDNFQGKAGWLTGWHVPHVTRKTAFVVELILKAFEPGAM